MIIRDITAEDQDLYFEMSLDFYQGDATLFPMTKEKLQATLAEALDHSPYLRLVVIEEAQQVVGYGLLAFYWSNEAGGLVTQLEEFYILPAYRKNNLGHLFLEWLFETYRSQTARFRLEVCPSNEQVMSLYEHYGFKKLDYIQMVTS